MSLPISLIGWINILKMNILPKCLYFFQNIPLPPLNIYFNDLKNVCHMIEEVYSILIFIGIFVLCYLEQLCFMFYLRTARLGWIWNRLPLILACLSCFSPIWDNEKLKPGRLDTGFKIWAEGHSKDRLTILLYHLWAWTTKAVISNTGIFVAIANNTLYGSKWLIFLLCQKSLGY